MHLKTNENVPVHGSDAVHVRWDEAAKQLVLYWGESKLYQTLSTSLDKMLESIGEFCGDPASRAPRERDIDVLRDHSSIGDPALKEALLEYFDPYSPKSNQRREAFGCLAAFEFDKFVGLDGKPEAEVKTLFEKTYKDRILTACDLFADKVKLHKLTSLEYVLFLLPFPDVEAFRAAFAKVIS